MDWYSKFKLPMNELKEVMRARIEGLYNENKKMKNFDYHFDRLMKRVGRIGRTSSILAKLTESLN